MLLNSLLCSRQVGTNNWGGYTTFYTKETLIQLLNSVNSFLHSGSTWNSWARSCGTGIIEVSTASKYFQICKWTTVFITSKSSCKFFIMSTEFDKNISAMIALIKKKGFDFFTRLVEWPKIDVKKCQNLIFKVDFQRQKSFESF